MHAAISITVITLGFIIYHFTTSSKALRSCADSKWGTENAKVYWIYFQRLLGFVLYGFVPLVVVLIAGLTLSSFGVNLKLTRVEILWILGLSLLVIGMNKFASKSPENLAMYPQIRVEKWSSNLLINSAVTWMAYLLAYEFLFRGYLLFSWEKEVGAFLAIAVNVSVYALVHVPKGIKEAIGAIPLGVVLCLLTLKTGSIWIAFVVHVAMALSNEWFSIYYKKSSV